MSKIYVAGPAYVWIGTAVTGVAETYSASNYSFFGFTERGLTIGTAPKTEDVSVDYAGAMPADVSMLGVEARISGTFTRYNESLLQNLMANLNGVAAGSGPSQSIGTLLQSEQVGSVQAAPPLLVYSPYASKTEFSDMIKTMRFYSAYVSENLPQTLSVRRKAPEVTWRAIPSFGTTVSGAFSPNTPPYDCYALFALNESAVIASLPAVN